MALISCPECGKSASSLARACPHCGYSIAPQTSQIYQPQPSQQHDALIDYLERRRHRRIIAGTIIFVIWGIFMIWLFLPH